MVVAIRNIEQALGRPEKRVSDSERKNISSVRKGIYAARAIKPGEVLTPDNISTKRPAHDVDATQWNRVVGRKTVRQYEPDEAIEW
jgi:N,N'-diacetyllegionaminate synthase